jgi:hypothetical protein
LFSTMYRIASNNLFFSSLISPDKSCVCMGERGRERERER